MSTEHGPMVTLNEYVGLMQQVANKHNSAIGLLVYASDKHTDSIVTTVVVNENGLVPVSQANITAPPAYELVRFREFTCQLLLMVLKTLDESEKIEGKFEITGTEEELPF